LAGRAVAAVVAACACASDFVPLVQLAGVCHRGACAVRSEADRVYRGRVPAIAWSIVGPASPLPGSGRYGECAGRLERGLRRSGATGMRRS
jgi:hypothetical protein